MLHDRQSGGGEETLHHVFVHAGGGAEDARADVSDVGKFEQSLDGAIFAEGSVQHGKNNVDGNEVIARAIKLAIAIAFKRNQRATVR